jgi:hypothetical protein
MATPVNEFDKILQAEVSRTLAAGGSALILSTTSNYVFVDGSGGGTPSVINMVATPISVVGTVVFTTSPSVTFSVDASGKIFTMNQSAMGSSDVTVTATLTTPNGLTFSDSKTVKRVTIGSLGYTGALNATANSTTQGLLSARPTGANGDFYFATDTLTLYQKIGGAWTAASTVGANAANFTGTLGGDNLMWNSGFELRAQAGSNRPSGYNAYNNGGISVTYMDVLGRTGGKAFALRANATTTNTFGLVSDASIVEVDGTVGGVRGGWQPNKTYIVSFKAKKVNGAGMNTPELRWGTAPASVVWVSKPALTTSWQTYTARITWGSSAEANGIFIDGTGGTVVANDEFHVDDLIVQEGDVYSEWFPSAAEAKYRADTAARGSFTPLVTYDFSGTVQGWYGENSTTLTANANSITVTATNADPMLAADPVFSGAKYDKVRARVRRIGGSGWDGFLFYGNASHGENGSYFGLVSPDPTVGGNWVIVEWDMAKSSSPTDWTSGNVTHLRLDLGNTSSDVFEVDWISIGRYGVGSDEAMAALSLIADDNVLSKGEKSQVIADWNAISGEKGGLDTQADALGVSRTAYDSAYSTLSTYLGSVAYNDTTTDTAIVGSDFRTNFTNYYTAKQALLNAMAAKAATLASWAGVSGAGKPADNATVGAPPGTYVGGTLAQTVEANANAAKAAVDAIADDNTLSKGEKSQVIGLWNAISGEKSGLDTQADSLGVSRTAYDSAYSALSTYLGSVSYSDTSTDTAIVGSTFRANFTNYYTAKQALINAIAAKAATMADYGNVTNRFYDSSNLIKKGMFDDGTYAGWTVDGIENVVSPGAVFPYQKNIWFTRRDSFETGNDFPVTPGETLYFSAWLETTLTDYTCSLGVKTNSKSGAITGWNAAAAVNGRNGWTYVTGSCTVPADSTTATPWIQMNGFSFSGQYLRAAGLWIGRHAPGATVGAPSGTLVAGVSADTVATAATNFNSSNDRNGTAVTAPTVLSDGTAVDHTIRTDGSADISFEWGWSGNEGDIDGFLVYVYQSSSSSSYSFGTTPAAETVFTVPAAKRAFILFGSAANLYTTFGVQAYRAVDKDINASGVIKSTLVKSTLAAENPYQPSSNVAFSGSITGTLSGASGTFAGTLSGSQVVTTGNLVDNAATDTALVQATSVSLTTRSPFSSPPSSNSDYTTLASYSFTPAVTGVVTVHYACFVKYTTSGGGPFAFDVAYIKVDTGGFSSSDNTKAVYDNTGNTANFTGSKRLSVTAGVATTIYFRCSVGTSGAVTSVANDVQMIAEIIKK